MDGPCSEIPRALVVPVGPGVRAVADRRIPRREIRPGGGVEEHSLAAPQRSGQLAEERQVVLATEEDDVTPIIPDKAEIFVAVTRAAAFPWFGRGAEGDVVVRRQEHLRE